MSACNSMATAHSHPQLAQSRSILYHRSHHRLPHPIPCQAMASKDVHESEPSTSAWSSSNVSPVCHPSSSRRSSLIAATSCLLLSTISPSSSALEEQQVSMASDNPTPVTESPGLKDGEGRLPPLADRPGASGKQLLIDPKEFTYAFESEVRRDAGMHWICLYAVVRVRTYIASLKDN